MSVRDRNGVVLTTGQRVEREGRYGKVVGTLGRDQAFVLYEGETDDVTENADELTTVDRVTAIHRSRQR